MDKRIIKNIILLLSIGFILSCNSNQQKSSQELQNSIEVGNIDEYIKSTIIILNDSELNPDSLIAPEDENPWTYSPVVKFLNYSSDTIYLQILNEYCLTQSMGTTGAAQYIDSVSLSFLRIEGIEFVDLSFDYGDHASPGVYSKSGYKIKDNNE